MRIINGRVLTMEDTIYENGYIEYENGKIVRLGNMDGIIPKPEDIDAEGKYVLPGFVDPHCHIGLADDNELCEPLMPQLRIEDSVDPFAPSLARAAANGVTSAVICPGSADVMGGMAAAIKTYGTTLEELCLKTPCALKMALGENPKRCFGGAGKSPSTRMGETAIARQIFYEARDYMNRKKMGEDPAYDPRYEALIPVLEGKLPVHCHTHRADDALSMIRIAKEFSLRLYIIHATGCQAVADILARDTEGVAAGPFLFRSCKPEMRGNHPRTPYMMWKEGISCAICTDFPAVQPEYLRLSASAAANQGLPEMEALKAITIYAAQIGEIEDRVGSLAVGKDADIVIWDDMPLEYTARPVLVITGGVPLQKRKD